MHWFDSRAQIPGVHLDRELLGFEGNSIPDVTPTRTSTEIIVEDDGVFAVEFEVGVEFVRDVDSDRTAEFEDHHAL